MKNNDTEKELYTGAWLLKDLSSERPFGMTAAFGPSEEEGTVRVALNRLVNWESDADMDLTIDLSEAQARQLLEQLTKVVVRLEHLRGLHKLGQLSPEAYYPNTNE